MVSFRDGLITGIKFQGEEEGFQGNGDELSEGAGSWRTKGRSGTKERLEVVIYLRGND